MQSLSSTTAYFFLFGFIAFDVATCSGYSFITLGDWGGAALEESFYTSKTNVYDVAKAMANTASQHNAQFVVNTGDNFYWCGIQNTSDYQVQVDFLEPYNAPSLNVPWYSSLGNHEYGYNVSAQIALSSIDKRWIMDDRYYTRRIQLDGSVYASLIVIDSSPCISEYRSTSKAGWDPCGTQYPTCSLKGGKDDFEGECMFHQNIMTQDCTKQFNWFKKALDAVPQDDWLIIIGHHPADEIDVEDFTSAMQARGFDIYLNGHAHTLTQYTVDGGGSYVTSGAGSLVNVASHDHDLDSTPGKRRTGLKVLHTAGDTLEPYLGHNYATVFNQKVAGFTVHTFSSDFKTLTTDYIAYTGETIHTFTTTKGGSPSPSPSPSPTPGGGSCCYYSDSSCVEGQICCKSHCNDPSTCSYTQYGCSGSYGQKHRCHWTGGKCVAGSSDANATSSSK